MSIWFRTRSVKLVYPADTVCKIFDVHGSVHPSAFGEPPAFIPGTVAFYDLGWSVARLRGLLRELELPEIGGLEPYAWGECIKREEEPCYRRMRLCRSMPVIGELQMRFIERKEKPLLRQAIMGMLLTSILFERPEPFPDYTILCAERFLEGPALLVRSNAKSRSIQITPQWARKRPTGPRELIIVR